MCDASECFDEILTQIGEAIKRRKKLKSKGFLKIVGYELVKRYQCECKKKNEFPLDPNQFMLFSQVGILVKNSRPANATDTGPLIRTRGKIGELVYEEMLGDPLPNEIEHFKTCKRGAKAWSQRSLVCNQSPKVISMNLVWEDE